MSLLGGIRPPIAVLSVLLLALAALTAFSLGRVPHDEVPEAVLTSQQQFAEDGAIAMRASLDEGVTDLNRAAALFNAGEPVSADAVLDKISSVYQKWRGTAVVEITSGKLLAARGENVPLTAIDRASLSEEGGLHPRMMRLANGETRLLSFALLSWEGRPQQLLVASNSLRFPGISLGQFRSIAVLDTSGAILSSDGIPEPEQVLTDDQREDVKRDNKQLEAFAKTAAKKAQQHPLKSKAPGAGGFLGVSGSLVGGVYNGDRATAGYATLAAPQPGEGTSATALGLTVVAMIRVAEDPTRATDTVFGILAAGALLVIGIVVVALLLSLVQRPLIRLFLEGRRLARGDLQRPVSVPRYGEGARIGAALERLRSQLLHGTRDTSGPTAPRRKRRLGARALMAGCAVLILAWSGPLALLLNRADSGAVIPQQLVNDQRERTDTLTDRVRRALNEGHADLASVASQISRETTADQMTDVLERTAQQHLRYQSLYVRGDGGEILARTGGQPHDGTASGDSAEPIAVTNHSGKEPVIVARAVVSGSPGATVVGEFRIDFVNSLLKRPGLGDVRVVDAEGRVLAGNTGYRAFQKLPSDRLDALVTGANVKAGKNARAGAVLYRDGQSVQIAAAAPFVGGGAAKPLSWTVVSWRPAAGLVIPEYTLQNRTVLAGLLGLTAAAACLGWLHIVVARPMRALAGQAEALADGDRRTVLYPRHHDEVGAVVRSLEVIRQQLQEQRKRDGAQAPAGRN
ncbi:HAMP domain-containing protein [Streptomyces sp. NPDC088725]|uniref:HAMP domain-containing protein n=1 Tax=Streptomyces sp. NPDC088725 TaxID=3365873 RepID=UPI0038251CE7